MSTFFSITYTEKIAQLIDFTAYLKEIVDKFEKGDPNRQGEPPLGAYFVDLGAELITKKGTKRIPIIDDYIHQWTLRGNTQHLAILGEYGTGKSSWCQKFTHDLAASYLQALGSVRIPILFNLREFTKTLKIESLVTSFLDGECGVLNPRFRLFQTMNNAGIFLLIFDGFDEMAVRVDADTLEINLQEIEKLAASPNSKVIITSRLEYFISGAEENKILCPKGELLATRQTEYEPLKIVPWDDEQINSFLKKRVPLIKGAKQPWTFYRDCIKRIEGLSDLSRRPVLLDMIAKTLPQLIESGKPINRPNLYETYLFGEIKRQKILKQRTLLLSEASRFSLLKHLALDFYVGEISAITFTDALKHIEEFVKPPKSELEAYTRDFLTCSFLTRKGDEYQFSHRSIMEYLIAIELLEEIKKNEPNVFSRHRIETVVAGFIIDLNANTNTLWNWIESTKSGAKDDIKYLGGNAATLLCMGDRNALVGKDLSRAVLFGANLISADLRGVNLSETVMKDINLANAHFFRENLESAKISDFAFSLYYYGDFTKEEPIEKERDFFIGLNDPQQEKSFFKSARSWGIGVDESERYRIGVMLMHAPDIESLQLIQNMVAAQTYIKAISLYADDLEKFLEVFPEPLKSKCETFIQEEIKSPLQGPYRSTEMID